MGRLVVGLATAESTGGQPKALDLHLANGEKITIAVSEIRDHRRAKIAVTAPDDVRIERIYDTD